MWRWMERRKFRGASFFMLLIFYYMGFLFISFEHLDQIQSFFLKKFVLLYGYFCCLTCRRGCSPFEPKYKRAFFHFPSSVSSGTCMPLDNFPIKNASCLCFSYQPETLSSNCSSCSISEKSGRASIDI